MVRSQRWRFGARRPHTSLPETQPTNQNNAVYIKKSTNVHTHTARLQQPSNAPSRLRCAHTCVRASVRTYHKRAISIPQSCCGHVWSVVLQGACGLGDDANFCVGIPASEARPRTSHSVGHIQRREGGPLTHSRRTSVFTHCSYLLMAQAMANTQVDQRMNAPDASFSTPAWRGTFSSWCF